MESQGYVGGKGYVPSMRVPVAECCRAGDWASAQATLGAGNRPPEQRDWGARSGEADSGGGTAWRREAPSARCF